MKKNHWIKWLVTYDQDGELIITEKKVSKFAPINRVLDKVGFYALDSLEVHGKKHMLVFEHEEANNLKSKLLISRIREDGRGIQDMGEEDKEEVDHIARLWMASKSFVS
jgi:hypothetical protein